MAAGELKQAWLNIATGEFSESWSPEPELVTSSDALIKHVEQYPELKLIEYRCLNDEKFSFTKHMKLC